MMSFPHDTSHLSVPLRLNAPNHFFRQAANCARDGTFVKGGDSIEKRSKIATRHGP